MTRSMTLPLACTLLLGVPGLVGCGGGEDTSHVSGAVKGDVAGNAGSASRVRAVQYDDDGTATTLAEGEVDADGSYTLDLSSGLRGVVIVALDGDDAPVGAVILATTGAADATIAAAPIDDETTVEATIYVDMILDGMATADVDFADLRARVDATVAASADDGGEIEAALAVSVAAAQMARFRALTDAGVSVDALLQAEDEGLGDYDASLVAQVDASVALDQLLEASAAAEAEAGADADTGWEAQAQANLSATALIRARLGAGADAAEALTLAGGRMEAHLAALAAVDAAAATGNPDAEQAAVDAGAALELAVDGSDDPAAAAAAWGAFTAALVGPSSGDESVLDLSLGLPLDLVITETAADAASMEASIEGSVAALPDAADTAEQTAVVVGDAWGTFSVGVRAAVAAAVGVSGDGDSSADLVLVAMASGLGGR